MFACVRPSRGRRVPLSDGVGCCAVNRMLFSMPCSSLFATMSDGTEYSEAEGTYGLYELGVSVPTVVDGVGRTGSGGEPNSRLCMMYNLSSVGPTSAHPNYGGLTRCVHTKLTYTTNKSW